MMRKLALLTGIALVGGMAAQAEVVFFDDFSSYDGSINGDNWNPKWDGNTNFVHLQQNLMMANDGVLTLDTSKAYRNFNCPNSAGFTVVSNMYIVTDVQYDYAGGGNIASNFNKSAFGLNIDTTTAWWSGTKKSATMCNRGSAIGNTIGGAPWVEGWQSHSTFGVNTANAESSDWFKVANKLVVSNDTVWLQSEYYLGSDAALESPIHVGVLIDTGISNNITLYGSYNTGWNDVGAEATIASFSKFTAIRYDNFYVGTKEDYEATVLQAQGYEDFYVWQGSLSDFWHPHTLYAHGGTDKINNWGYWFQTTNAAYADPQDKFMQHRPGIFNDPGTTDKEGGTGWRGQFMKDHPARGLVTNEMYEVSFEYKLFANDLENNTFMDMFFSTNNVSTNAALAMGSTGEELGFRLKQSMWSNSPETTNGSFTVQFDAANLQTDWSVALPDLGITVVDEGSGVDLEGDDLFVTYTALKTTNSPVFECKLVISNEVTGMTFDSGAILVSNALAYAGTDNQYLCFYTGADLGSGSVDGDRSAGYEIDDVNGRIVFYKPVPPVGYALWALDYPGADLSDPLADYDNDGIDNLTEYALNGDPTVVVDSDTQIALPAMVYGADSNVNFYNVMRTDPDANLQYIVERRDDLNMGDWIVDTGWNLVATNAHALDGFDEMHHRTWGGSKDKHFFRLRIVQP